MKTCSKCGSFTNSFTPRGRTCKPCRAERQRLWRAAHPEAVRAVNQKYWASENGKARVRASKARHYEKNKLRQRLAKYSISVEDYRELVECQGGVCAICGQPETAMRAGKVKELHIDHDHATDTVRGLLCGRCNVGIGMFCEDEVRLRAAVVYLAAARTKLDRSDRRTP